MNKRAQDIPGWMYIVGLIIMLIGLGVMIYIAVKGGQVGSDIFSG